MRRDTERRESRCQNEEEGETLMEKKGRNSPRSIRQVRRSRDRPPEIVRVSGCSTSAEASN